MGKFRSYLRSRRERQVQLGLDLSIWHNRVATFSSLMGLGAPAGLAPSYKPTGPWPQEAPTPFAHGGTGQTSWTAIVLLMRPSAASRITLARWGQSLWERLGTTYGLQLFSHPGVQSNWWNRSTKRHGFSFRLKKPTIIGLLFRLVRKQSTMPLSSSTKGSRLWLRTFMLMHVDTSWKELIFPKPLFKGIVAQSIELNLNAPAKLWSSLSLKRGRFRTRTVPTPCRLWVLVMRAP